MCTHCLYRGVVVTTASSTSTFSFCSILCNAPLTSWSLVFSRTMLLSMVICHQQSSHAETHTHTHACTHTHTHTDGGQGSHLKKHTQRPACVEICKNLRDLCISFWNGLHSMDWTLDDTEGEECVKCVRGSLQLVYLMLHFLPCWPGHVVLVAKGQRLIMLFWLLGAKG